MNIQPYHLPSGPAEYFPNQAAPLDRWLQAENASNADTTAAIVRHLCRKPVAGLLDPFAGGGSSAVASRNERWPFFGIELDPILACATLAKTLSEPQHTKLLAHYAKPRSLDALAALLASVAQDWDAEDSLVASCLALTQFQQASTGRSLTLKGISDDLDRVPEVSTLSRVIWGDSLSPESWAALQLPPGHIVIYTSPPFGASSPRLATYSGIESAAKGILINGGVATASAGPAEFPDYRESTLRMMRIAASFLECATVIIEHEPSDDGSDARAFVAETLASELGPVVADIRVLESQAFSRRGPLSLIVCQLGQ